MIGFRNWSGFFETLLSLKSSKYMMWFTRIGKKYQQKVKYCKWK